MLGKRIRQGLFPVVAALAVFLIYPSLIAQQDVVSLLGDASSVPPESRRLASLSPAPGISYLTTGSIGNTTETKPEDRGPFSAGIAISTGVRAEPTPQRVNRTLKGGRIVSATSIRPPEQFNAGRVSERHSALSPLDVGKKVELAFVKARPAEEALQVAFAFHPKLARPDPLAPKADLPVMVASLVRESTPNIVAYVPEPEKLRSPFAAVLEEEAPISLTPRLDKSDHAWAANPLPKSSFSDREQHCLTAGIYFEARGEPVKGQAAVAQVILNRVRNPTYPDTICGVVYQNKEWRNRCQFSFACDRIKDKVRDPKRWKIAQYVARETTEGRIWLKEVGSSTHYHATYVSPKWARTMKRVGRIGLHVFYRTFGGGWS
ncbi:MAG: cell wall hydrolase [Nitratireductor sp.]|nr:cell wall hydrolase [Nitratireductor sp.]